MKNPNQFVVAYYISDLFRNNKLLCNELRFIVKSFLQTNTEYLALIQEILADEYETFLEKINEIISQK